MVRSVLGLVLFVGLVSAAVGDDKDPVKEKLFAAKQAYDAELKLFRKQGAEWFDKREDAARNDGNKKLVDQIKEERATFDETGELPKAAPAALRQKSATAKKTLDAAYSEAVKQYTKARKDPEAAAVEAEWKSFGTRTNSVDLLALVDTKVHAVLGDWKRDGESLVGVSGEKQARLQLPYEPGEEYDVAVRCKRVAGDDCFCLGLVVGGHQVLAQFDSLPGQGYLSGLDLVDMKSVGDNATTVKGQFLKLNQYSTLAYSVRSGKIDVSVNGKSIISYRGKFDSLSLHETAQIPNEKALFLFVGGKTSFQFDRVVVTPIKGRGKILK